MAAKGECFVIAPIGEPGSDTRKRTDDVFEFVIEPAVEGQYEAILPYRLAESGRITMHIIERLVKAPLVVADLTDHNANVYYELSLRHVLNQPVVLLIEEKQLDDIPFDAKGLRTVTYDLGDPRKIQQAVQDLKIQVDSLNDLTRVPGAILKDVFLVPEAAPEEDKILLGSLLIANRYRFELIEPYFETLATPVAVRNKNARAAFQSLMWESAQKTYLQRTTIQSAFRNRELRDHVAALFDEVEEIIPLLSEAINRGDEEQIKTQLARWRGNNTAFLRAWAQQYIERVTDLKS